MSRDNYDCNTSYINIVTKSKIWTIKHKSNISIFWSTYCIFLWINNTNSKNNEETV